MSKTTAAHASAYQSYLLRLWRTEAGWIAVLENPHTHERTHFACLEQLFVFLMEQTEGARPQDIEHKPSTNQEER